MEQFVVGRGTVPPLPRPRCALIRNNVNKTLESATCGTELAFDVLGGNENETITSIRYGAPGHDADWMRCRQRLRGGEVWSAPAPAIRRDGFRPRTRLCVDRRLLRLARWTLVLGGWPLAAPAARPRSLGTRELARRRPSLALPPRILAIAFVPSCDDRSLTVAASMHQKRRPYGNDFPAATAETFHILFTSQSQSLKVQFTDREGE
jgi:hypothetical protein